MLANLEPGPQDVWVDYHNDARPPLLFLSGPVGRLVDSHDSRRLLVGAGVLEVACTVPLVFVHSTVAMVVLVAILGAAASVAGATWSALVPRIVYPVGFQWSRHMKPAVSTDLCMHAHVGFLARGEIHIEYADGCVVEHKAPQIVAIEPGHDGWVVGKEPVVLIEFDFEGDTIRRLGMPDAHRH